MSLDNIFQTKTNIDLSTQVTSNEVTLAKSVQLSHIDPNTTVFINNSIIPLGNRTLLVNDKIKIRVSSSSNYSDHVFGYVKLDDLINTFTVITKADPASIHIPEIAGDIPFELTKTEDDIVISEQVYRATAYKNKIYSYDTSEQIQYPDEIFKFDYSQNITSEFNSDECVITCSYYNNKVLKHSRKTKDIIASIDVSGHPCEFTEVLDPVNSSPSMWVTLSDKNSVAIISSGNVVIGEYSTGEFPTGIVYNGTSVYVANSKSNSVSKFDYVNSQWISTEIPVGIKPFKCVIDNSNNVWVTCANDDKIYKISDSVVYSFGVGSYPRGIAYIDGFIWVTLSLNDKLIKLDLNGNIVQNTVSAGIHPYDVSSPVLTPQESTYTYSRDDWFSSNILLINSNNSYFGANNSNIKDSSGTILTIEGNPQHAAFSPYQDAWSCEFNNGQITLQQSSNLTIGTSDFTIEFWINFSEIKTQGIFHTSNNNLTNSLWCGYKYDGLMLALSNNEASRSFGFWFTPEKNRWIHIAISRGFGSTRIYVNGQFRSETTSLNGVNIASNNWLIGNNSDANIPFNGNIADFHVTKQSKYTDYSVVNYDKIQLDQYSILYTLCDKNFTDKSVKNIRFLSNSSVKMTTFSPYSLGFYDTYKYSGFFNGTTDYLRAKLDDTLNLNDFTFETWVYKNTSQPRKLIQVGNFVIYDNGGLSPVFSGITNKTVGEWYHLSITRKGNVFYRHIDGILINTVSSTIVFNSGYDAIICQEFSGYVMNYRLVMSALYTSANYTIQKNIPVVPKTKLLLKFKNIGVVDATGKSLVKTNKGVPYTHSNSKFGKYALSFNDNTLRVIHNKYFYLFDKSCTIEFWISTIDKNCIILSKSNSTFTNNSWRIKIDSNGKAIFEHSSLGLNLLKSASNISDGFYHHIAMVKNGNRYGLFVDGVREDPLYYIETLSTNIPSVINEQTTFIPIVNGVLDNGILINLTDATTFNIISGSEYAYIDTNNNNAIVIFDISSDKTIVIEYTSIYGSQILTQTKSIKLSHNPELLSIDIIGDDTIDERSSSQYSIRAYMSNNTSYVPNNTSVIWSIDSDYASVNSNGLVTTNNIQDSNKSIILNATFTDITSIESETKTTFKNITVNYYPELIYITTFYNQNLVPIEGSDIQLEVIGTLENGSKIQPNNVAWSVINGSSYCTLSSTGLLKIKPNTKGNTITIRCAVVYVAGPVTNTITKDLDILILPEFLGVELLLSGDVLKTTLIDEFINVEISGPNIILEDVQSKYETIGLFGVDSNIKVSKYTTWKVISGEEFATIDEFGLVTPLKESILQNRTIIIEATTTIWNVTKTSTKTIIVEYVPVLANVVIDSAEFDESSTGLLLATAFWDDGTSFNANPYTTWELVSGSQYATVLANGQITTKEIISGESASIKVKATTVRGNYSLHTEKDILVLNKIKLSSVYLSPDDVPIELGSVIQFSAIGIFDDATTIDLTEYTSWSITSGNEYGTINSIGQLTITFIPTQRSVIEITGIITYSSEIFQTKYSIYVPVVENDLTNVAILLNGENITPYSDTQVFESIFLNGENITNLSDRQIFTPLQLTGEYITDFKFNYPNPERDYVPLILTGELPPSNK